MAILVTLTLILLCAALFLRSVGAREKGLPPGPPTLPILGNLHIFPKEFIYYKFTEWARKYGGIYSLKLGPGTVVVLTDAAAVKEIMDKRSATTSDRPNIHVGDLVTGGLNLGLAHYGDTWRTLRRAAHAILTPQATARHLPIQQAEATQLLHDILCTPESFYNHIRRYSSSVILSVLCGKRAPRYETPETTAFFHVEHEWELLLEFGATPPVDMIPLLKLVPERWAKWKRDSKNVRALQRALYFGLVDEAAERVHSGGENGSYIEELLVRQDEFGMDREMTGYPAGVLVEGGSETTSSYLSTLILALVAYPDARKKAHEEIDRVVGEHRLPTLDDLEHMPYIRAMILEAHRFRPVLPLAIPHATIAPEEVLMALASLTHLTMTASIQYQGYIIPKGAMIFVNTSLYDDPEDFIPERYLLTEHGTKLGVDGSSLRETLADQNINAMNLVWAFNFESDIDAEGNSVKADTSQAAYTKGLTTGPAPFKCRITPRTGEKAEIIRREFIEAADTFSKFEYGLSPEDKDSIMKWAVKWSRRILKIGPGTVVVLTDAAAVKEIMDKRSATTSDRPSIHMADLVTGGLHLALMHYGDPWRTLRRAAHTILTPQATALHLPIQQAEATQLLYDILCTPQSFYNHIQRYSSSVILSVLCGKRAPRYETPETTAFFHVTREWELLLEFGATPPVDMIPFLKLVPERWAKWKRDSKNIRALQRALYFGLLDEAAERVRRGDGNGSYIEEVIVRQDELGMDKEMTGYLAGVLLEGGSGTTSSYLSTLILALVAYPDAQKKAHEEIDRVVGEHRLPTLDDLEHMPYIRAMILEAHRFRPVFPLAIPHATTTPEEYEGYIIPKGATIFINTWGIYHDPALYDDPDDFIPDRYLLTEHGTKLGVDGSSLRETLAFGAGRRLCPGIHLAENSININAMNLVWAFNFESDIDADGNPVKTDTSQAAYVKVNNLSFSVDRIDLGQGPSMGPAPFKCRITPRTGEKAEIIRR
ncbi:cytochrome P450, partial [Mycena galericulata]